MHYLSQASQQLFENDGANPALHTRTLKLRGVTQLPKVSEQTRGPGL